MSTLLHGTRYLFVKLANGESVYCPDVSIDINCGLCDTDILHPTCGYPHTYTVLDRLGTPLGFIAVRHCTGRESQVWKEPTWTHIKLGEYTPVKEQ